MSAPGELDPLVTAAVNGDRESTGRLLRVLSPLVLKYCRARVGRQERTFGSADDVAQEVCLAVLKALPSYRDQGRPFLAFVYGIAAHKVADAHRSSTRNRSDPVAEVPETPEVGGDPEARAIQGELAMRMDKLMSTLAPRQQEIVRLRVVWGLSAEETAETVGSTPGAVRVSQHRALNRLRKMLAAEEDSREANKEDWLIAPRTGDAYLDHLLNTADKHLKQLVNESPESYPLTMFGQDNAPQIGLGSDQDSQTNRGTGDAILDSLLARVDRTLRDKMPTERDVKEDLAMKRAADQPDEVHGLSWTESV